MKKYSIFVIFLVVATACSFGGAVQSAQSTATSLPPTLPSVPTAATDTPAPGLFVSLTPPPSIPTSTVNPDPQPTFPLELTLTPGIIQTATAYSAAVTAQYQSYQTLMGPFADMLQVMQYFSPVGTPVQLWNGVPVMSQATAGQQFKPDVYSYKATATIAQAQQYYTDQSTTLKWSCNAFATGSAGLGPMASHSATLTCPQLLVIDITSLDSDTSHVIVVINKAP